MRQSLFVPGAVLCALSAPAIGESSPQRPAPRVIEAAVTPEGRVVAVQPSVERLNVRTGATSRSPCGAIDMDAATARAEACFHMKYCYASGLIPVQVS